MKNTLKIKAETVNEQEKVLQILENQGYLWWDSQKPTEFTPITKYGKKYVYIEASKQFKRISTDYETSNDESVENLTFREFLAKYKTVNTKVIL